ncbi:hypothetical protein MAM1_0064c03917 [Mucor ambiguus]|uniref:Uncharacterized protein n=1 Tax=Mucor ambiguus TaxID=91626 RepID=A0A0C9MMQ5_9FUNG|nr:hypothetical protein MAM1_0064c03917 [Mucor ambiguus]
METKKAHRNLNNFGSKQQLHDFAFIDKRYANEKHGAYAFRIHESAHHLMNPEPIPNPNSAIQQPNGIENIQIIFRAESDTDIRCHNALTADEICVLIVGGEDESSI